MIRSATALFVFCLFSSAVAAKEANVGPASLNLTPPQGYCEMDAAQPSDARMLTAINGMLGNTANRLLVASAECNQLKDWRTGKRQLLDNTAQYQTMISLENAPLPATPEAMIKDTCNQLRAQGEQMVANATSDAKTRAEKVLKTIKVNESKFMGVVGEDPLACYAAVLQEFTTETGAEKTQVIVFATTVLKGKIIYYYLYAPYVSGDSVTQMLAEQRVNVTKLQAANPN